MAENLTAALVAFQAELPDVSKGGTNPAFKSKYATLPDVTKAVFPLLTKHGLAFITIPDESEHGPVLRWELRHVSGESISGVWGLPDGVKAQELGSWITYGRRYILSAVTGVTPEEDDDGNRAQTPRARRPEPRAPELATRIARAATAIGKAGTRAELDKVWADVKASGLDNSVPLLEARARRADFFAGRGTAEDWAADPVTGELDEATYEAQQRALFDAAGGAA